MQPSMELLEVQARSVEISTLVLIGHLVDNFKESFETSYVQLSKPDHPAKLGLYSWMKFQQKQSVPGRLHRLRISSKSQQNDVELPGKVGCKDGASLCESDGYDIQHGRPYVSNESNVYGGC
ncbi:hypothetical protein SASPL_149008 [Salvia splendens]|uniref:Uncharacterized protein n=1 Tax=Salvia splendens TaxID=180675 RepID=A0A8X8WAU8_SALSN|nr:hypothetical protein SASPL_149008 [Salvia splendens]